MNATGLDVIDKSVQVTNTWLNEMMEDLGPDRRLAWHVLGVVLRTLRDWLPFDLAAHLGAATASDSARRLLRRLPAGEVANEIAYA